MVTSVGRFGETSMSITVTVLESEKSGVETVATQKKRIGRTI
jgi:hypothetical protein